MSSLFGVNFLTLLVPVSGNIFRFLELKLGLYPKTDLSLQVCRPCYNQLSKMLYWPRINPSQRRFSVEVVASLLLPVHPLTNRGPTRQRKVTLTCQRMRGPMCVCCEDVSDMRLFFKNKSFYE